MATSQLQILLTLKDQASASLNRVEKATGGLHSKMLALAGVATAAVGAFASFRTLESIVNTTQELGEAVHDMGEQTGLSAENSSRLIFALKATGVEIDKGSTALGRFAKNMFAVTVAEDDGSKSLNTNQKILAGLGVTVTETTGQMRPLGDILMDLADKISAMGDSGTKTALVLSLFGKGGLPMLEFLNQGKAGIKALSDEADRLGLTLSGKNVADVHAFTVAHRELDAAIGGLKLQIGLELIPELTKMANWFMENQPRMREFIGEGIEKVRAGLASLGKTLQENRQTLIDAATGIAAVGAAMFEFGSWLIANKVALIAALIGIGAALITFTGPVGIIAGIVSIAGALGLIKSAAYGAKDELSSLLDIAGGFDEQKMAFLRTWFGEKKTAEIQVKTQAELIGKTTTPYVREAARMAEEDFMGLTKRGILPAKAAVDAMGDSLLDLPDAAGGAAKALTAEQEALLGLMNALAAANMTGEQFIRWQIQCQNAAAFLTQAAAALGVTFESLVDAFLRSGLAASEFGARITALTALKDLQAQAEDANDAVNNLYDSFNNLFSKPTVEGAAQKAALDQLKLERAELVAAAGGKVSEHEQKQIDKVDDQIAAIQRDIDVRRAEEEVMKDGIVARDATKLTDEGLAWAVGALTEKMGPLSTTAADFNTQLFWATASLMDTTTWFQKLTGGVGDAWRAFKRFSESTPGEREALAGANAEQLAILWQGGKAPSFQMGGVMPFTGLAHLEAGERVIPAGRQLTAGESKRTLNFYAPITVQMPSGASSLEEELERLLR